MTSIENVEMTVIGPGNLSVIVQLVTGNEFSRLTSNLPVVESKVTPVVMDIDY